MVADRRRSLVAPREHGAWGILLVPLVTGAGVALRNGGQASGLAPLVVVALTLFWLRTPVESWMGAAPIRARTADELRLVRGVALGLAAVAVCGMVWLFWGRRNVPLVWIGAAAGAAFGAQFLVRRIWRGARMAPQMVGTAGLTLTAPAAYCVAAGRLDTMAWSLWAANLLFALNQIQFVQLRIHAAKAEDRRVRFVLGFRFFVGQLVLMALIVVACAGGVFAWSAAIAFVPILARGFLWFFTPPGPLAIHALGKSELAYACAFGVLLIVCS